MTERTSLTDADLDRIEAEANAATPGPWSASEAVEYRPRQGPFSDTGASIWSESQKHPSGDEQEVVAGGMQDEQGGAVGVLLNADARFIAASRTNVPTLIAEVRRLRAAQTTTLIACSRCGHGQRVRNMVALGDERLCVECAGVAMRKLAQAVIVAYDDLEQRNETDAVHALDDVYDIALHAADAPGAGEGNTK